MQLYNTYTSSLETFVPRIPGEVSIYVCGPTVYNFIHIGNARPVIVFDTLRRYFESKGNLVRFASNFTDVDDKIIQKAIAEGKPELEISSRYIEAFLKDVADLGSKTDYIQPKVTEYMAPIIAYIDHLVQTGYAYVVEGDVYFRVSKIEEYGHLSNRKIDDLQSGSRVEINEKKENPLDFALWKKTKEGITWESNFGPGRPGWHTECCVMIDEIFGGAIDIHGGGADLIFPHHENEIAQSVATHQHGIASFWMHNGRLNIEGNDSEEKMSKSAGSIVWVKDLKDKLAFRLYVLATHYRAPLNFSFTHLETYEKEFQKMTQTIHAMKRKLDLANELVGDSAHQEDLASIRERFDAALELDFNTPNAITELQALLKSMNILLRQPFDAALWRQALIYADEMTEILGLQVPYSPLSLADKELFVRWDDARKNKDFAKADEVRGELQKKGLL